jgi:methyl-accepting chemotaxis protein
MNPLQRISLVPKLALISALSMVLMAGTMFVVFLNLSYEKTIEAAKVQATTALRVFDDSLSRGTDAFSTATLSPGHVTAMVWTGERSDIPLAALDRVSDLTGAQVTFYSFDVAQRVFVREATTMRQADGTVAVGTPLDSAGDAHAALQAGRSFEGHTQVLGQPYLTLHEPVLSPNGEVVGAISAAVPQSSLAATRDRLLRDLAFWLGLALASASVLAIMAFWVMLRPLAQTTRVVSAMADRDFSVDIPATRSADEVGRLARAVAKLRDDLAEGARLSSEAQNLEQERERQRLEQVRVVNELTDGLSRLADGDLTRRIDSPSHDPFPETYETLRESYNAVVDRVGGVMARVTGIAEGVRKGSQTITQASRDLSSRTESQAATLEQSAAALNQLTVSVRSTAESAAGAENASRQNRTGAEEGAEVVGQAVAAMQGIEKSSEQITRIIGVIDDIAFQTNLLALNAGVEAARAGEAGRGFAVVASEVRLLAQRASDSAQEIKELISESAQQVEKGSGLVNKAGAALSQILERAQRTSTLVGEIASAAAEQANGLKEINTGINQLDHATQQNRAVSEEATASAADLLTQADALISALSEFRVATSGDGSSQGQSAPRSQQADLEAIELTPKVADWKAVADAAANAPRAASQGPVDAVPRTRLVETRVQTGTSDTFENCAPDNRPHAAHAGGAWHEF